MARYTTDEVMAMMQSPQPEVEMLEKPASPFLDPAQINAAERELSQPPPDVPRPDSISAPGSNLLLQNYTAEEAFPIDQAPAPQRPAGGSATLYPSRNETSPNLPKPRYSTEEVISLYANESKPRMSTKQVMVEMIKPLYDPTMPRPDRDQYFKLREVEKQLRESGDIPSEWEETKNAVGGFFMTALDAFNTALWKVDREQGLFEFGGMGVNPALAVSETIRRSPGTLAYGAEMTKQGYAAMDAGLRATGGPRYRVKETGEFVVAGDIDNTLEARRGISGGDIVKEYAARGLTLVPVGDEDKRDFEYLQWNQTMDRAMEVEKARTADYPEEVVTKILSNAPAGFVDTIGGTNYLEALQRPAPPMESQGLVGSVLADPATYLSFGAGAARIGLSAALKGATARSLNVIGKGAQKFARPAEVPLTQVERFRKMVVSPAKVAGAYGAASGVAWAADKLELPSELKTAAFTAANLYTAYKGGLGVLRFVGKRFPEAAIILRESADATSGLDNAARQAVAVNPDVPASVRDRLLRPSQFVSMESTPARLAQNQQLSPSTRALMDKLSNFYVVQGVRGTSALATGAAKGTLAMVPFAEATRMSGDERSANVMYGMGAALGALGGGAERVFGARSRRIAQAESDVGRFLTDVQAGNVSATNVKRYQWIDREVGRLLTDVELAAGDVSALVKNRSFDELARTAAMQGFFRDKVDYIPLNAADFQLNADEFGADGSAGFFINNVDGQRPRIFVNVEARRADVEPHEYFEAFFSSGAFSPEQRAAMRAQVDQRYGVEGLMARGREYAESLIKSENSQNFPNVPLVVSDAQIQAKMEQLAQDELARGGQDPLDWVRREVMVEEARMAGIDFASIRRNVPQGANPITFIENVLGANARALGLAGVRIDPETGAAITPEQLFKENPVAANDPKLVKQLNGYIKAYRQWMNDPQHEVPQGIKIARDGRAESLANNPNVEFYSVDPNNPNAPRENAIGVLGPDGRVVEKTTRQRAKERKLRGQQIRNMVGSKLLEPSSPTFGLKRWADGRIRASGKRLPDTMILQTHWKAWLPIIRSIEALDNAGESQQIRYFAKGNSADKIKSSRLSDIDAINREMVFDQWTTNAAGDLLAQFLDFTTLRNRAMRAIAERNPALDPARGGPGYSLQSIMDDVYQWMADKRANKDGGATIGNDRKNVVNALINPGTNLNREKNPLAGAFGRGSAIKTLLLEGINAVSGTGRKGAAMDYNWANGNFMPDLPNPRPDVDSDVPAPRGLQAREAQAPRPQMMADKAPDIDPIEDSARKIHSVYDKNLLAKDRDTALYPQNPVPGSVVLPPRYGLVGNAPGMPRNFTEVRELVKLLADRVEDTGRRDVPFAQKSARFYSDMANEAVSLAEIVDPQATGTARFDRADEMLRYLALGSQRTNVPVNSTKSAGAAASVVGNFTAGYKMGFGEAQRATRQAQADFKAGKHFNLDTKGVQDKVRTFYINGLSELIELARKSGDRAAVEMLETRAAKSLKLVDPNTPKLTPEQLKETERILAGKATIDMWDMAAKRVAVPGFILDPKKRVDLKQPFEWTQKSKAAKDTIGSPRWAKVAKELGIDSPAELRYQQARSLGIEGNFDWTAETWKTRVDSGAPFAGGDFTTYTGSTDAGLSPGGGGRLYDAQQAIDGLLADELNRRGLASMFGKDKLFARNAQEILWAIEKKDNPILANNDLSLFGDSIQPLRQELEAIAERGGQRNIRGAQVLDAMERAYTAMAMQEMPFEVATVGTGRTANAINSALATMEKAGDSQALARLTAHFANNLADELTGLATEHGIKLQVDSVKTDLGGFTMDDGSYTETPQITAVIRGNTGDTKYLMQVVNEAVEQQGGNLFRRPSVKELYDPAVEKQPVVSFETSQMTTAQRTAFVTDLAKIRDSKGNRIFTGYTPSENGVFIGGQFYDGDFAVAVDRHDAAIRGAMKKHGVSVMTVEDMIVPSYRSSDPVAPSAFRDAVQKLFYNKAVSGVATDAPTSVLQPANVQANLQSRLKKNEAMFAGRDNLDALAKAINESGSMSADQALARVGQTMQIPGTKKMQAAFSDYVRGNRKKYDALPAADKKAVSEYIKQAREEAKALRDQEAAFSRAAKEGIRRRRSEIADRYDPQRALDEIDAASLLGYMGELETAP